MDWTSSRRGEHHGCPCFCGSSHTGRVHRRKPWRKNRRYDKVTTDRSWSHAKLEIVKMKSLMLAMVSVLFLSSPVFAVDDDSTLKKGVKVKAVKEADDDSVLKKGAKLKVTKEVVDDEDDSALKKGAKLKVLKKATEDDDN